MNRRAMLTGATLLGASALSACAPARIEVFGTWAEARNAVASLGRPGSRWHATGAWNLSPSLQHLAQSVEGSLAGYPQLKPAWFVATVGRAAHAVFEARGRMTHPRDEPIPGAAPLEAALPCCACSQRWTASSATTANRRRTSPTARSPSPSTHVPT